MDFLHRVESKSSKHGLLAPRSLCLPPDTPALDPGRKDKSCLSHRGRGTASPSHKKVLQSDLPTLGPLSFPPPLSFLQHFLGCALTVQVGTLAPNRHCPWGKRIFDQAADNRKVYWKPEDGRRENELRGILADLHLRPSSSEREEPTSRMDHTPFLKREGQLCPPHCSHCLAFKGWLTHSVQERETKASLFTKVPGERGDLAALKSASPWQDNCKSVCAVANSHNGTFLAFGLSTPAAAGEGRLVAWLPETSIGLTHLCETGC